MKFSRSLLLLPLLVFLVSAKKYKPPVYDLKYVEDNMVYIPKFSFVDGPTDEDVSYSQVPSKTVSVDSFYMSKFEVTNGLYCFYLAQLRSTDTAAYRKALPDTLVWRERLAYNEPYVIYYLRHPAYSNYPLVGVTYEQACDFCKWLTSAYDKMPGKKFVNATFDLPTKDQWMSAAKGGDQLGFLPWKGYHMRNANGELMANFLHLEESSVYRLEIPYVNANGDSTTQMVYSAGVTSDEIGEPGTLNDAADITAPVNSYWPNQYGLYNMSGNVEEFVKEKNISKGGSWRDPGYYLRITTEETYVDSLSASTERGFRIMMNAVRGDK